MLVITRREGEEVVIGEPQNPWGFVRVVRIGDGKVRLAFSFPTSIAIHRREVADEISARPLNIPKYKVGDVVRYGDGPSALMKVESVSANHGGAGHHRYYGMSMMGGTMGAYEDDCRAPTDKELEGWKQAFRK